MIDRMPVTRVSVIIPSYRDLEHLKRLLPTIAKQTFEDYEIVIIDDCSGDQNALDYVRDLAAKRGNMRLLENDRNLGFVRTCNKGIAVTDGSYVCLLNSDTEVKESFIQRNVEIMDSDSSIGALSCIIVDQHGDNWFSGGVFRAGATRNLADGFDGVRPVDFVSGTAPFYRRELFKQVGNFDESFVMYHEDVDMCQRIRAGTGYRVCMFGEKLVTHHLNRPDSGAGVNPLKSDRLYYYLTRNDILLVRKHCRRYLPVALLRTTRKVLALAYLCLPSPRRMSPRQSAHAIKLVLKGARDGLLQKLG